MTKSFYLTAALLITASPQCHAMEKQNVIPAKILATITAIKRPLSVVCLLDSIAILGKDGCGLYDLSGKEIITLQDYTIDTDLQRMSAHPNKKTLAIRRGNFVKVYDTTDTTKKRKIYNSNLDCWFGKPIFNSIDDTILIGTQKQNIRLLNYKNNLNNAHIPPTSILTRGKMLAFHPTKQEFLFTEDHSHGIYIFQIGKDPLIKKTKIGGFTFSCQYSPDGALIAVNNENGCFIYPESDLENSFNFELDSKYRLGELSNERTAGMVFHSTGCIVATLSSTSFNLLATDYHINYWNTQTLQRITSMALDTSNGNCSRLSDLIDFSSDGKNIVIVLNDKCLVIETPFEVLSGKTYELDTKNRCAFTLWAMQHYLHNKDVLPHDITRYLTYTLLAASKL